MSLEDEMITRQLVGAQRRAEVVDTSKLTDQDRTNVAAEAARRWALMRQRLLQSAEIGLDVAQIVVLPNFMYHSAKSRALVDELIRLATEDGVATLEKIQPNKEGATELFLEFDVKGAAL